MADIIRVDFAGAATIKSRRVLRGAVLQPAVEDTSYEVVNEHASEPIMDVAAIEAISDWFVERGRYRDNMLFIVGINFGLRVSDLLTLRFSHLIEEVPTSGGETAYRFKTTFPILEKKTKNTRKVKKNRYISINEAVMDAVTLYLEHTPEVKLSDYMFRSESNCGKNVNRPIHRNSVERILKEVFLSTAMSMIWINARSFGYQEKEAIFVDIILILEDAESVDFICRKRQKRR